MKELSMVKRMVADGQISQEVAEKYFPELKESEGERIRGAIIDHLKDNNLTEWAAWLEKQGDIIENNMLLSFKEYDNLMDSINKKKKEGYEAGYKQGLIDSKNDQHVQPKFKVGDTIRVKSSSAEYVITDIYGGCYHGKGWCLDIISADRSGDYELVEQKPADNSNYLLSWSENEEKMLQCLEGIVKDYWAKAEQEKNEVKIKESSNVSFFLKTIHKQPLCWIKCSDRLPNKDGIYLVVTDGLHNDVYDMARYDSIEGWHKASEIIYWMPIPQLNDKSIIEQKPADKTEPKFKVGDIIQFKGYRHNRYIIKEVVGSTQYINSDGNRMDRFYTDANFELVEQTSTDKEMIEALRTEYEKGRADAIAEVQKSAWSEEDNINCKRLLYFLDGGHLMHDHNIELSIWLESLKERVQPQPNQEWSEEDEEMYKEVLTDIIYAKNDFEAKECLGLSKRAMETFNWFSKRYKSIRPQTTWMPSYEQMEALLYEVNAWDEDSVNGQNLKSLYQDLQKLMKG